MYEMTTLYDRGYEGWIAEDSEGDAAFRDNFQPHFPETDYSVEEADETNLGKGLLVCLFILAMVGILGLGIKFIQDQEMGLMGFFAAFLLVAVGVFGASFLADQAKVVEKDVKSMQNRMLLLLSMPLITQAITDFQSLFWVEMKQLQELMKSGTVIQQFSIKVVLSTVGRDFMRDNVWGPFNLGVSLQWIILGMFVGVRDGLCRCTSTFDVFMLTRNPEHLNSSDSLDSSEICCNDWNSFLYGIASSDIR